MRIFVSAFIISMLAMAAWAQINVTTPNPRTTGQMAKEIDLAAADVFRINYSSAGVLTPVLNFTVPANKIAIVQVRIFVELKDFP